MVTKHCLKAMFAASMLVSSVGCSDELTSPPSSDSSLYFTVEESDVSENTRSAIGNGSILSSSVTPVETTGRTLYLHACEIRGIEEACLGGDTPVTRGVPVTDMEHYKEFLVSAAFYQEGGWDADRQTANFMYKVPVNRSGSVWSPQSTYYWPGKNYKMRFYAYAPKDAEFELSEQSTSIKGAFIKYEVPADVTRQKDLLVAQSDEYSGDYQNPISLQFKHALTAVKFAVGGEMKAGTIRKVALRNIHSAGRYYIESGETELLTGTGTVKDFEQILEKHVDGTPETAITEDSLTFMLPPQELPDNALLEIVFVDDDGGENTLSASLKKAKWNPGTTVVYKISTSSINWEYVLEVKGPAAFSHSGGSQSYSVASYKRNTQGKVLPVAWSAKYSMDNGQSWTEKKPDWLTAFTISGEGGEEEKFSATVIAQTGTDNSSHTMALQGASLKGSETTPYNLSNSNGGAEIQNTANCYVVNSPGYYSLPLVYGNAIKNSATNTSAYVAGISGKYVLTQFVNHLGKPITNPYIANNSGCVPSKAELVWQDALSLVSDIQYHPDNGNISFKVDRATIKQGNAVIAIKDENDQILWSWHIWVTDERINETIEVTNMQGRRYKFMRVNLGWCDGYKIDYAERSCIVKFTNGGLRPDQEITIKQDAMLVSTDINTPYYQWGRKDPFRPSDGLKNINKIWYDKDGISSMADHESEKFATNTDFIKSGILKPDVMNTNTVPLYYNLWSARNSTTTNNDNAVVKTVYDPSPVGFKLPASNAFTGFTLTGTSATTPAEVNGVWNNSGKYWNFYSKPNKRGAQIAFLTFGSRDGGRLTLIRTNGYYWTAIPDALNLAHSMTLTPTVVHITSSTYTVGFCVRPCQD